MATRSKRQILREKVSTSRRKRTSADREKMRKDMLSPKGKAPAMERILTLLEPDELTFLDKTVAELKPQRRRTSRNELVRLGIAMLRKMEADELLQHLRDLD
jgi:hypothetical protein